MAALCEGKAKCEEQAPPPISEAADPAASAPCPRGGQGRSPEAGRGHSPGGMTEASEARLGLGAGTSPGSPCTAKLLSMEADAAME